MRPRNCFVIAVLLVILIPGVAGFGYIGGTDTATADPGDEVHFKLYLFGTNESVKVTKLVAPDNWRVNISPRRVNFPVEDGFRYIEAADGYRKVVPVRVTATVPKDARSGTHTVTTFFTNRVEKDMATGVAVRQVQDIRFDIEVVGSSAGQGLLTTHEKEGVSEGAPVTSTKGGGMTLTAPRTDGEKAPTGEITKSFWERPVVLLLLFEITWGIALIYVLKRRESL